MGQQQLMLVILVIIVVGIATIVATNVISSGAEQANRDAIRQDLLNAASSIQGIWEKPTILGGAGKNFQEDFSDEQLANQIDITGVLDGTTITNDNAEYSISSTGVSSLLIEAIPANGGDDMSMAIQKEDAGWIYTLTDGDNVYTNETDEE